MRSILLDTNVNTFFILGDISHQIENPYFLTNNNKLCSDYPIEGIEESGKEVVDISSCYGAAEWLRLKFTGRVEAWNYPRGCIVLKDHTEAKFNFHEVGQRHPHVGQVCKKTGTDLLRKSPRL